MQNKEIRVEKPIWRAHRYQIYSIARGFEQKYLAYFLDPGLGKTTIILQLYKMLKLYGKIKGMLVIAPIRVCYLVWPLEVQKWSNFDHFKVNIMHGPKKNLWDNADADIHVINPEGLPWLLAQLKGKRKDNWPFRMLVCDESTLFKNRDSVRFKNVKKLVPKFDRRYILTGTPIPNGYMQLFSQVQIVDEGFCLGTKITYFRQRYFDETTLYLGQNKIPVYTIKRNADKKINKKISPFVVRLSAEDHLNLPPLVENKIFVDLPKKTMKQYDRLKQDMFLTIKAKEVYPSSAASLCQKLHQIANGNLYENWDVTEMGQIPPATKRPYFHLHKEKLRALEELIAELNGKPLFVAYWYHHELIEIQKYFKECKVINSRTTEKEAVNIERDWNQGNIPLLFAQPASVAHGLNFQGAGGDICWYSMIYDFEIFDQYIKRIWRQGVKNMVRNHFLIARGTIDEAIYHKLHMKKDEQDAFFGLLKLYQSMDV